MPLSIYKSSVLSLNITISDSRHKLWIAFDISSWRPFIWARYVLDIPCDTFLVNGHDPVPDSALTSSSFYENNGMCAADRARLNSAYVSGISVGSWSAATNNLDVEYIQVISSFLCWTSYSCNYYIYFKYTSYILHSVRRWNVMQTSFLIGHLV